MNEKVIFTFQKSRINSLISIIFEFEFILEYIHMYTGVDWEIILVWKTVNLPAHTINASLFFLGHDSCPFNPMFSYQTF